MGQAIGPDVGYHWCPRSGSVLATLVVAMITKPTIMSLLAVALATTLSVTAGDIGKINRYAWSEVKQGVRVAVSTELAIHTDGTYLPLLINVVNRGSGTALVDLGAMSLRDADGTTYRSVPYRVLLEDYRDLQRDKRLTRQLRYGGLFTHPERMIVSRFYPYEQGIQDPTTELLTQMQMIDIIYFEVPKEKRRGRLTLVAEGIIDAPAFRVPFQLRGK